MPHSSKLPKNSGMKFHFLTADETPYHRWMGKSPDLSYIRVFSCKCWFVMSEKQNGAYVELQKLVETYYSTALLEFDITSRRIPRATIGNTLRFQLQYGNHVVHQCWQPAVMLTPKNACVTVTMQTSAKLCTNLCINTPCNQPLTCCVISLTCTSHPVILPTCTAHPVIQLKCAFSPS